MTGKPQIGLVHLTVAVAGLLLLMAGHSIYRSGAPAAFENSISLELIGSTALPDSFPVSNIFPSEGRAVALVAHGRDYILIVRGDNVTELGAGMLEMPVAVSFTADGKVHEVVDVGKAAVLTWDGQSFTVVQDLSFPFEIAAATRAGWTDAWIFVGRDSTSRIVAVFSRSSVRGNFIYDTAYIDHTNSHSGPLLVASHSSSHFIIGESMDPSRIWLIATDREQNSVREIRGVDLPQDTAVVIPFWVLTGIIPVSHDEILLSVADLRSDRRQLIRTSISGTSNPRNVLHYRGPLGLAAKKSSSPSTFGIRKFGVQEIVEYDIRQKEVDITLRG